MLINGMKTAKLINMRATEKVHPYLTGSINICFMSGNFF